MTSSFEFSITPIFTLSESNIISNIITINGINLLFDCGSKETHSLEINTKYESALSSITLTAIFLSNNYINYYGALPLIKSFPQHTDVQTYSTTPIQILGTYAMEDAYISAKETNKKPIVELKDPSLNFPKVFFKINDLKYHQSINIIVDSNDKKNEENMIIITPFPSGNSFGGCAWRITYKLYTWIYAPEFSIEPKFITDPFPYTNITQVNTLITDSLMSVNLSVMKKVIDEEFKAALFRNFNKKKTVFIPTDSVNYTLELVIRLEKILSKYNVIATEKNVYQILVCGYSSVEICEGIKRLTEFMSTTVNQQYYSYNDKPFNFKYTECVKDMEEYVKKINETKVNMKVKPKYYIIISSVDSLNYGMSYLILPSVLSDENSTICLMKAPSSSMGGNNSNSNSDICDMLLRLYYIDNKRYFPYTYVKAIKQHNNDNNEQDTNTNNNTNSNSNCNSNGNATIYSQTTTTTTTQQQQHNNNTMSDNTNNTTKPNDDPPIEDKTKDEERLKSKLFHEYSRTKLFCKPTPNKPSTYLMFAYTTKNKYSDYGFRISSKELSLLHQINQSQEPENDQSGFQGFLNKDQSDDPNETDFGFKLTSYHEPYEYKIDPISIEIKCDIINFAYISTIDKLSKRLIIEDISPKDEVVFLGKLSDPLFFNSGKASSYKIKEILVNETYRKNYLNNLLKFQYDSSIFTSKHFKSISTNNELLYDFKSIFLKIKTKRNNIIKLNVVEDNSINGLDIKVNNTIKYNCNGCNSSSSSSVKEENYFAVEELKISRIKQKLEKNVNMKLFIKNGNTIVNKERTILIKLVNNELILNGVFSQDYMHIRKVIYDNILKPIEGSNNSSNTLMYNNHNHINN